VEEEAVFSEFHSQLTAADSSAVMANYSNLYILITSILTKVGKNSSWI